MRFLIDNGHGIETPGKRSPVWPDGTQLFEWLYNRQIAREVVKALRNVDIQAELLVPEDKDVMLGERIHRVNKLARIIGPKNVLMVSIHVNASTGLPDAKARGWQVHTYLGQNISDTYAKIFYDEAKKLLLDDTKMRLGHSESDPDWDSNFAMLRETICPSVLTENCFMDNIDDCRYLLSEEGRREITALHVNSIVKINGLR